MQYKTLAQGSDDGSPAEPNPTRASDRRKLERTSVPGVFRRGNGYVVRYRDPDGKDRKKSARTLREAREIKAAMQADIARGEYRAISRVTFTEYARSWIETYEGRTSRGIREETLADYRDELERFAIPFFARTKLSAIEPRHIKQFAKHLSDRGLAPNTVRLALAPVKALLATAFEEGVIRSNPAAGVRIAAPATRDDDPKVKDLTEIEVKQLLAEIPDEWRLFFEFLLHTGLRIGEAIALRWSDVDFGTKRVHVRRRFYRGGYAPPKSRFGLRALPLTENMTRKLWNLRKRAVAVGHDDPVFVTPRGARIDQSNLSAPILKPAAQRADVPWASFHTLRHTCETTLFRRGWSAKQVQLFLGHHSPAFTLAVYVHLLPDDLPEPTFLDDLTAQPDQPATEQPDTKATETG